MQRLSSSETREYLEASLADWRGHVTSTDARGTRLEVRVALRPDAAVLQLWWMDVPSPVGRSFMWDSLLVAFESATESEELLRWLAQRGVPVAPGLVMDGPFSRPAPGIPLYQYHPQRFRAVIPYAKSVAQLAQNHSGTFFSTDVLMHIAQLNMVACNEAMRQGSRLRYRLKTQDRDNITLVELAQFYGEFVRNGRQIFEFPVELTESFRHSDVEDIPLSALQLPYESFYLYFGPQRDLAVIPGWHPDGVYVSRIVTPHTRAMQFCLTSQASTPETYMQWVDYPEPVYIQAVSEELMGTGVGEAVDRVLSDTVARLRAQVAGVPQPQAEELQAAMAEELGGVAIDVTARNAERELAAIEGKHHAWREMLNLVVNAICYLTSYTKDVKTEWPARTPKDLQAQAAGGTPKQRLRAVSKLAGLGYTQVHLCGLQFAANRAKAASEGTGTGKPTWVRGTWVNQAYGPRWSLRRLQWRMPYLRNREDADVETVGHLYTAE